jgi:xanthine/CO dehydrogenase XdhC/CoxF family maturation factor
VAAGDGEWWFNVVAGEKLTPMERRDIRADARRIAAQGASAMVRYGLGETSPEVAWFAVAPQPVLIIGGATPDSRPVAAQAAAMGWHVTVIEHRPARAAAFQIPGVHVVAGDPELLASAAAARPHAACVVMYHHRDADQRALAALAALPPGYVGMLGPRARTAELLRESAAATGGWPTWLRAPVGLDVGAEGADEVALSIVAELVAWSHGATGGALSARDGAIHLTTRADSLSGELLEWSRVPS